MASAAEEEARTWAWVSLIAAAVVALLSLPGGLWPVFLVELISFSGSVLFLYFGKPRHNLAMVLMFIAAVVESVAGVLLAVYGLYLINNPSDLLGWAALIGIYALVISVPVLSLAAVDIFSALRIRALLYSQEKDSDRAELTKSADTLKPKPMFPL